VSFCSFKAFRDSHFSLFWFYNWQIAEIRFIIVFCLTLDSLFLRLPQTKFGGYKIEGCLENVCYEMPFFTVKRQPEMVKYKGCIFMHVGGCNLLIQPCCLKLTRLDSKGI